MIPRRLAHLPTLAYRLHLGWLVGTRFVLLHHVGRRTGRPYRTVLRVLASDDMTNSFYVAAARGVRADWYQNILAQPRVEIQIGSRRWKAVAEGLTEAGSKAIVSHYAYSRPRTARAWAVLVGFRGSTARDFIQRCPVMRLRTTQPLALKPLSATKVSRPATAIPLAGV